MTVKHLLREKGRDVWTIGPDETVLDALAKMAEKNIGSLVVMEGEELIGIITERAYSRNVILKGRLLRHHAGQGHHGEKRNPCSPRTVGRIMHGPDDQKACASPARSRRKKSHRRDLYRRFTQAHNF